MNDKTAMKCVSSSMRIWKKAKKQPIHYEDELSVRERGLIMADSKVRELALQKADLEKQIVNRIDEIVTGDRNKSQLEKDEEARKFINEQKGESMEVSK